MISLNFLLSKKFFFKSLWFLELGLLNSPWSRDTTNHRTRMLRDFYLNILETHLLIYQDQNISKWLRTDKNIYSRSNLKFHLACSFKQSDKPDSVTGDNFNFTVDRILTYQNGKNCSCIHILSSTNLITFICYHDTK